ncbi:hypothetical protein BZG36_00256 [Bifiguratus adelaidae]|uniref:O-methyltransferase domain-containing protein n=1 Tax=Bifiguratus adelaidae TaxID=1938954 RepID=A0A261Y8E5_9FUNG|nr:hypothetical protein BZG36_00256 [Bifiguratus adelaidae]
MLSVGPVFELINGFRRSKVLFTAVSLGIFDVLAGSETGLPAKELLRSLDTRAHSSRSEEGLERLLKGCASLKLLEPIVQTNRPILYRLTSMSRQYLTSQSPESMVGYIRHSNDVLYPLWSRLDASVLSGEACWTESFGRQNKDIFSSIYEGEGGVERFTQAMDAVATVAASHILQAVDLSWIRCMADLGGSSGALSAAFCERIPHLKSVVIELPHVIPIGQRLLARSNVSESIKARIHFSSGDFFASPEALPRDIDGIPINAYLLSRILHDWRDPLCLDLLRHLYTLLPSSIPSGVVICEMLLNDDGIGPVNANMQDLNMLAQTDGKERSLSEMRNLLEIAGFQRIEGYKTGSLLDVVVAYKT